MTTSKHCTEFCGSLINSCGSLFFLVLEWPKQMKARWPKCFWEGGVVLRFGIVNDFSWLEDWCSKVCYPSVITTASSYHFEPLANSMASGKKMILMLSCNALWQKSHLMLDLSPEGGWKIVREISWFAMMSSKIEINSFSEKKLHNVNNPILKYLCKFQVDIPINARIIAVQSLEHLNTFICDSHVGRQKNAHQPTFPYTIIDWFPYSFPFSNARARLRFSIRTWGAVRGKHKDWQNQKDFLNQPQAIVDLIESEWRHVRRVAKGKIGNVCIKMWVGSWKMGQIGQHLTFITFHSTMICKINIKIFAKLILCCCRM